MIGIGSCILGEEGKWRNEIQIGCFEGSAFPIEEGKCCWDCIHIEIHDIKKYQRNCRENEKIPSIS